MTDEFWYSLLNCPWKTFVFCFCFSQGWDGTPGVKPMRLVDKCSATELVVLELCLGSSCQATLWCDPVLGLRQEKDGSLGVSFFPSLV